MCEPMRIWRITFNGLLRRGVKEKRNMEDNENDRIHHVQFRFIWTCCSDVIDIQRDWSTALISDALAREPWRNGNWMKMRKQLGEGYDQWGTLQGTWTLVSDGSTTRELYLRGIRQRRYGTDDAVWQRRAVSYVGVTTDGSMFSIEARCNNKPGITHAIFGHVYQPNGCQASVYSCDLSLPNLGEHSDSIPQHVMLRFSAGRKNYTASLHTLPNNIPTLYGGRPWTYEAGIFLFRCTLNDKQGAGTAVFWYRYSGPSPAVMPLSLPILKEPHLRTENLFPLVVDLKDRECSCSALVGGKGSALALMTSLDKNQLSAVIPPGFCVTVAALEMQMQQNSQLQGAVAALQFECSAGRELGVIQEQCTKTVALFESTAVCEAVSCEVSSHLQNLLDSVCEPHLFAVRSSAVGEDTEDLSSAGQNKTLLGVCGELTNLLEAIQSCWASLYSLQSVQYRRQFGQPVQVGMGIVVQQMVPADSAGVLFTWHPSTGDPRQMLITANFGLGESVVSAQVEPDTVVLERDRTGRVVPKESICGNKGHRVIMSAKGGLMAEPLQNEKGSQLCLTEEEALRVGRLGLQLEQMFGGPRDIEWAISNGQIYLLQSRPITSFDSWSKFELLHEFDDPIITDTEFLTTANTGEVFPGLMTPLTQSVTRRAADLSVRHQFPDRPGYYYSANVITASYHAMFNVFNSLLVSVGSEVTLGEKVVDLALYGHPVTTLELLQLSAERNGVVGSLGKLYVVLDMVKNTLFRKQVLQQAEKLTHEFLLDCQSYNKAEDLYSCISNSFKYLDEVSNCHGKSSKISVFTQVIAVSILTEGREELTAEHYSDMGLLLSSCSDLVSAGIPVALEDLASSIIATDKARDFCTVLPSEAVHWLEENYPSVATKLQRFLDKYGHRCIKEFELMTETWGMNPEILLKTLQTMVQNAVTDKFQKTTTKQVTDKELLLQLKTVKKHGTRVVLGWLLPLCRSAVWQREANKDCYITIIHQLRLAYRHLAQLMVKEGRIPDAQLMFFFTHYELGVLLQTRDPVLITKALHRRRYQHEWKQLAFPEIIRGLPVPVSKEPLKASGGSGTVGVRLQGTPVCSGTVMGRACVVRSLEQIGELTHGDILITHSTDVGWSPYFPLLEGVVTELGGLISHGAVVAREYGLPCIVGCQDATRIFSTGDTVLLVGAMGTVERINKYKDQKATASD
ncbi:prodigiosin synthesizing transferase PigC isoform X3 [Cryptotermes secundus]|nr:prodigiosin synthesizing transferase PigC isoform X3 [Cryptotermes secundus]